MRQIQTVVVVVVLMAACSGGPDTAGPEITAEASTKTSGATTTAEATTTTSGATDRVEVSQGGAFNRATPELRACLRTALGDDAFNAINVSARGPTGEENARMSRCFDNSSTGTAPSGTGDGGPGPGGFPVDEWVLAETGLTANCPSASVNHAETGSFAWVHRPMLSGEVANFAISPTSPNVIYMGIEVNSHSVYRSDDFGDTWTRIHRYDHAKDMAVHPTDPNTAFHADSNGVWLTSTGGLDSFEQVVFGEYVGPAETSFSSVVVSVSNPEVVYTAQKGGDSRGSSVLDGGVLYRSTDGGRSFQEIATGTPVVNVLAVDPTSSERLLLGSTVGIHESTDGGVTWQSIPGASSLSKVRDVKSLDGSTWFAATDDGVARSVDGGLTWQLSITGLPNTEVQRVEAVRDAQQVVWATTRHGVVRSTDGGETFFDVSGFGAFGGLPAVNLNALGVWPDDPDRAIVSTNSLTFSVREGGGTKVQGQLFGQGIFKTEDAGTTWRRVASEAAETSIVEIQTNPLRPTEVWAGQQSSRGIFRSRDAGQSWSQSNTLLTHYPMKIAFVPGHPDRLVMTSSHSREDFGVTTNSGESWFTRSEQTFFDAVELGSALLDENIRDNGNLHLHGVAVAPDDPNLVLVGSVHDPTQFAAKPLSGTHIYRSADGGSSWVESMDGYDFQAQAAAHDIVFDPTDPDRVYVGTTSVESVFGNGIWRSLDRGYSWERANSGMPDNTSVNEIVVHPTNGLLIVAATDQGMYASTDRGDTWTRTDTWGASDADADVTNPGVVYAATVDGVLVSQDFGQTWQNITVDQLTAELGPPEDMGIFGPSYAATAVGVSCDGAIVYAAIEHLGVMVSVAPGYQEIPEDPDQVSITSGRAYAQNYDEDLRGRRANRGGG